MDGVVVTGPFGSGKTTVVEELAERLEQLRVPYGAIDLDWIWWFNVPGLDDRATAEIRLSNLSALVANFVRAGVKHLLLAAAFAHQSELDRIESALGFRPSVVRLVVPLPVIQARLSSAVTIGRLDDLQQSEMWIRDQIGTDLGDRVVPNDRPVAVVAQEILDWLEWA
jgi:hypothetical protein